MSNRILVGTRKGTFVIEKAAGRWKPRLAGHAGAGVNFVARDPASGTLWATLGHGHWGAKLSRSDDDGATWRDAAQIKYPEGARYLAPPDPTESDEGVPPGEATLRDATLLKLWCIGFGKPGTIHVGTIPGGLFTSRDNGESFELNRALWNHESRGGDHFVGSTNTNRVTHWFGTPASEGEFAPGIHSIVVDPRNADRILVAISTAGVLETTDGGATWRGRNKGMLNDYLPDPAAEWGHDPHFVTQCPGQPDHMWQQNHSGVFYSSDGAATWKRVSAPDQGVHFGFPICGRKSRSHFAYSAGGRTRRMTSASARQGERKSSPEGS